MYAKKIRVALFSGLILATLLYPVGANADSKKNQGQSSAARSVDSTSSCTMVNSKDQDQLFTRSNVLKDGTTGKAYFQKNSTVGQEARVLIKKLSNKNKFSSPAIAATLTTALNTFETTRTNALAAYNNTAIALLNSCTTNIAPFKNTLNTSIAAAKATLDAVTTNAASTTLQIQNANDAYKSAVQLANTTYLNAIQPIVTIFRNGMNLAQVTFVNVLQQADQLLRSAIQIARIPNKK